MRPIRFWASTPSCWSRQSWIWHVADESQGPGVGRHMVRQAGQAGVTSVRVVARPPAEQFYVRMGAKRVGTVAPSPPKVAWERPDSRFAIPAAY
ncbi:acetyltransferase [Streptomyces sp. GBA 94-10 4N24]|nr:acetyltransferase [Streptomyces sp. GBA 94-10 4N24]UZN57866.1 acetyltransferase [Streptomyces sp. GBA 94-10 4N24]